MYRGTTPTITINCDIDVSEFVTMWVTFRTQQLATYAGKSLGEKISRNRHGLDADGNPLPDPSGDTLNNEEAKG